MVSIADRIRDSDRINEEDLADEDNVTFIEVAKELRLIYADNNINKLKELYDAVLELEASSLGVPKEDPAATRSANMHLDWISQVADIMLRQGIEDEVFFQDLGHSKRITYPICDFFRRTIGYEPDF